MPVQHDRREVLREFPINILSQDMPYETFNASIEHFLCRSPGGYGMVLFVCSLKHYPCIRFRFVVLRQKDYF